MEQILETERLIIRPFVADDLEAVHRIFGDPEAMLFIPNGHSEDLNKTRERLIRLISIHEKYDMSLWAAIQKENGELIGDCGVFPIEGTGPGYEVGYHFRRDVWGRGYASEAAKACLDYAFNKIGMKEILALAFPENKASIRVMEKIGMEFRRMDYYYNTNVVVYSKLRREKENFGSEIYVG